MKWGIIGRVIISSAPNILICLQLRLKVNYFKIHTQECRMGELFTGRIQSRLSNILDDNPRLQIFGRLDRDFAQAGLNKDGFSKL